MKIALPTWALRRGTPEDYDLAKKAHERGRVHITLPDPKTLRAWAKQNNWPTPWFGFENAFIKHVWASPENYTLALNESGLVLQLPLQGYTIPSEKLRELDALYAERSDSGRPIGWGMLVEELRQIRRAVEAGVTVQVDDTNKFRSFQTFYTWAHGRYHALEDGYDSWIGDDNS